MCSLLNLATATPESIENFSGSRFHVPGMRFIKLASPGQQYDCYRLIFQLTDNSLIAKLTQINKRLKLSTERGQVDGEEFPLLRHDGEQHVVVVRYREHGGGQFKFGNKISSRVKISKLEKCLKVSKTYDVTFSTHPWPKGVAVDLEGMRESDSGWGTERASIADNLLLDRLERGELGQLRDNMQRKLETFNAKYIDLDRPKRLTLDQIDHILEVTGGCLTGSFLIASVLEADYDPGDVDFFINASFNPAYIGQRLWGLDPQPKDLRVEYMQNQFKRIDGSKFDHTKDTIFDVVSFPNGVQFITVPTGDILGHIRETFDISVCTVALAHNQIHPPIGGFAKMFCMQAKWLGGIGYRNLKKLPDRLEKYTKRGFDLGLDHFTYLQQYQCHQCKTSDGIYYVARCGHPMHITCGGELKRSGYSLDRCGACTLEWQLKFNNSVNVLLTRYTRCLEHEYQKYVYVTLPEVKLASRLMLTERLALETSLYADYLLNCYSSYWQTGLDVLVGLQGKIQGDIEQFHANVESELNSQIQAMQEKAKTIAAKRRLLKVKSSGVNSAGGFSGDMCAVCYEGNRTHAFYPCGHRATCEECANEIKTGKFGCPCCRKPVKKVMRIFD